jgi:hypothetical protein
MVVENFAPEGYSSTCLGKMLDELAAGERKKVNGYWIGVIEIQPEGSSELTTRNLYLQLHQRTL